MKNTKLITMLCLGALIACSPSKKGLEPTSEHLDIELYPIHGSYGIIYFFYKIRVLFLVTLGF